MVECFKVDDKEDRCARAIVDKRSRSEILIFATISTAPSGDGKRNITLKAYWFEKGRDAFADQRICERCSDGTLSTEAVALLDALARAGQHATGTLRLSSTPSGASSGTRSRIDPTSRPAPSRSRRRASAWPRS